jgi:hypothetical protein
MTTPGSNENLPQGGAPQGQPSWGTPSPPPAQGYGQGTAPGYSPAPTYSGSPAGYGETAQRPGMVTAAAIIGIVWGALGALLGLIITLGAFAFGAVLAGLIFLLSTALSVALIVAGVQVLQGKSPRLLLLLSYVTIGLGLLSLIVSMAATGGNALSGVLGIIVAGVIVFLLMNPQSKQYYASRGISY